MVPVQSIVLFGICIWLLSVHVLDVDVVASIGVDQSYHQ